MRLLLILFLVVPLAEIYVLIEVGSEIGAIATVALVVLTAVVGAALMRAQGLAVLLRARATMARGEAPALEMLEGAAILIAGALLLTPGFITDAAGFACLIPPVRQRLVLAVAGLRPAGPGRDRTRPAQGRRTLEGEYRRQEDDRGDG